MIIPHFEERMQAHIQSQIKFFGMSIADETKNHLKDCQKKAEHSRNDMPWSKAA